MIKCLKPKKAYERKHPIKFAGMDIETDGDNNNEFVCACIYSEDFRLVFYDKKDLFNELIHSNRYRNYKFVCTNLEFDFYGCFQDYTDHIEPMERNGRIYRMTLYQNAEYVDDRLVRKNHIHFFDTLNFAPLSVEKLGKIVGIPKMDHPYFFPARPKNEIEMQMLVDYCMNDAMISQCFMQNIIMKWLDEQGLQFKMTIASIAMSDFQTNYLNKTLFVEDEETHKICFSGYYGGRTEVFQRGCFNNVYCYDVNSLYPSVMMEEIPNPNKSRKYKVGNEYILNHYEGIGFFKVFVPDMHIPPLPYRKTKGDKLIFPIGRFSGYYTFAEIRNAIKYGVKVESYEDGVYYSKTEKFFDRFVKNHYNSRKQMKKENNPLEIMEKGVLNNLYGKFALNYMDSSEIIHESEKIKDRSSISRIEPKGQYLLIVRKNCKDAPQYSFPIISAYITAYARVKMYHILKKYEHKVLYTDTDSIFMSEAIQETSGELGDFKLEEGYPAKSVIFIRPKVYQVIDENEKLKIKCKGFSRMTKQEFNDMIEGKELIQKRFIKHRSALSKKVAVNSIYSIPKNLDLNDDKRLWSNSFDSTKQENSKPIYINESI